MRITPFVASLFALLAFVLPWPIWAQDDFAISPFSGYTPGQAMPGSPAGSYHTSNFESYNPGSGLANINLPLFTVKGRGPVTIPVALPLSNIMWTATATQYDDAGDYGYVVDTAGWNPVPFQFGTPRFVFRSTGDTCLHVGSNEGWINTLTRGTLVMPDGTETEFVDTETGGLPEGELFDRGLDFISDDGSFATLTVEPASGPIRDVYDPTRHACPTVTREFIGDIVTRDGLDYRFGSPGGGYVTYITDRNGNVTTFSPQAGTIINGSGYSQWGNTGSITDSLGRVYQWTYNTDSSGKHYYTLQYPGANGTTRTITIWYASLDAVLAPGESIETFGQLWPALPSSLQGSNLTESYDPNDRVSEVDMPDGSKYTFTYHSYGDLAEIILPTGGVIQYDYNTSSSSWNNSPLMYLLTRPLKERRKYLNGTLISRTDYSENEIDQYDGSGALVHKTTFTIASTGTGPTSGVNYNPPQYDKPTQINYYAKDGTTQLESQAFTWVAGASCKVDCELLKQRTITKNGFVKETSYAYDAYNNKTDEYDYDWGSGAPGGLLRHLHTTYNTSSTYLNLNILTLPSERAIYDQNGNLAGATFYAYDDYGAGGIADTPGISNHGTGITRYGGLPYDSTYLTRGNLTSEQDQINGAGSVATTTYTYNIAGNILSTTDANGHKVSFGFDANYLWPTSIVNAANQQTSIDYDAGLGKPVSITGPNGAVATFAYNDVLDRLTEIQSPGGGNTYFSYPSPTEVVTQQDQNQPGDAVLKSQTFYDGFGRPIENDTFENGSQYIATTTQYDALGRVEVKTNPSRPGDGLNFPTRYFYDALGRLKQVKTADGAIATISYSGNQENVTDQAGNTKTLAYDGLGRLTSVTDATGTTTYTYNAFGEVTKVMQGSQTRTFSYDMLGRLTQATNPESGTVTYAYDPAGNLMSRTDARGVTTTYAYDALNRLTGKTYSDGTPAVTYTYDQGTNGKGHLTSIASTDSTTDFTSFDALGHVLASSQVTAGQTYNFAYRYNLAGALTSETYPSGRVLTFSHDGADRVTGVSGMLGSRQTTYVSGVSYAPQGAAAAYSFGNGLMHTQSYNSRLQLSGYQDALKDDPNRLLLLANLNWGTVHDNGDLLGETDYEGGPGTLSSLAQFNRTYGYDAANRLSNATDSGGWSRSFKYDQYGNIWVDPSASSGISTGTMPTSNVYDPLTNRVIGGSYDNAGNQLVVNLNTLSYNAENHMVSALDGVTHNTEQYVYDGSGQRVEKQGPSGTTVYVYDAFGQLAAEYSTVPQESPCTTCYLSYDQRGDVRMVTNQTGNVVARHDYLPFGTEVPANTAGRSSQWGLMNDVEQKFTGQIRDTETGMDYFQARYYGSAFGRFTSPDPANAGADPLDQQSWNAYAYVGNNPLALTDPSGMASCDLQNMMPGCSAPDPEDHLAYAAYVNKMMGSNPFADPFEGFRLMDVVTGYQETVTSSSDNSVTVTDTAVYGTVLVPDSGGTSTGAWAASAPSSPPTSTPVVASNPAPARTSTHGPFPAPNPRQEQVQIVIPIGAEFAAQFWTAVGYEFSGIGCHASALGASALVGVGSALGIAPPGSDPAGDAADALRRARHSPAVRATAGYYASRMGASLLTKAGAARLGVIVGERVVPIVGWFAAAYSTYTAAKAGASYYSRNANTCP